MEGQYFLFTNRQPQRCVRRQRGSSGSIRCKEGMIMMMLMLLPLPLTRVLLRIAVRNPVRAHTHRRTISHRSSLGQLSCWRTLLSNWLISAKRAYVVVRSCLRVAIRVGTRGETGICGALCLCVCARLRVCVTV